MAIVVVGLDGCRRDLVYEEALKGKAPTFLAFGANRAHATCDVRPVLTQSGPKTGEDCYWMTSPGWSSTLSGVDNNKHKVGHNDIKMVKKFWETSQQYPTFLEVAKRNGLRTMAVGRPNVVGVKPDKKGYRKQSEVAILDGNYLRGLIDHYKGTSVSEGSRGTKKNLEYFDKHLDDTDVAFLHIDLMDQAGHAHGWGSRPYIRAIHETDKILANLWEEQKRGRISNILITCDHGGFGQIHSVNEKYDRCILFMADPSLRVVTNRTVYQYDMAPTVLALLKLPIPKGTDGRMAVTRLEKHGGRQKKPRSIMPRRTKSKSATRRTKSRRKSPVRSQMSDAERCASMIGGSVSKRMAAICKALRDDIETCKGSKCGVVRRTPRRNSKGQYVKGSKGTKRSKAASSPRTPRRKTKSKRNSKGQFVKRK